MPNCDQIGGILDKTNAYKAKDIGADRDLVQVISHGFWSTLETMKITTRLL